MIILTDMFLEINHELNNTFPKNLRLSMTILYNIYNLNEFNFTINMNIIKPDVEYTKSYVGYYMLDTCKLFVKEKNAGSFTNQFLDNGTILVPDLFPTYILPYIEH